MKMQWSRRNCASFLLTKLSLNMWYFMLQPTNEHQEKKKDRPTRNGTNPRGKRRINALSFWPQNANAFFLNDYVPHNLEMESFCREKCTHLCCLSLFSFISAKRNSQSDFVSKSEHHSRSNGLLVGIFTAHTNKTEWSERWFYSLFRGPLFGTFAKKRKRRNMSTQFGLCVTTKA